MVKQPLSTFRPFDLSTLRPSDLPTMKHIQQLATVACLMLLLGFSPLRAQNTFEPGQIAVSGGLSYGFDLEKAGLRAEATSFFTENIRVGADITYWFTESYAGLKPTFLEFNGNLNYLFFEQDALTLYGIGTLGVHHAKVSYDLGMHGSDSSSDTKIGLGLGAGAEYNLGTVSIFAEPKFFLSGFDQMKLNFGVRYYL